MNIRICFILVFLFVLVGEISAQKVELGAIEGINLNVVTLKSDYQFNEKSSPNTSYNIGASLKINKGRKLGFLSLEYYRLSNNYDEKFIYYDEFGLFEGAANSSVVIHNIRLSTTFNFKLIGGLFCGGGIAGNVNINSKLKLNEEENYLGSDFFGDKFDATFIRDFTISIPIIIGYEFNKFDIIFEFDKGIMDRLNGNDGYIKEINNVLSLNFNYRFLNLGSK